ncbi:hypothetical protein [Massilia horti]|uniref:Uncharacterized protein n=1 Tax=Massilia horti TaxID=2562153 RepID=A0A4Y9T9L2_9BURK|nr:hypothetical protein [Massilia horti]TFW36205.1 hypothetical protein E4O92_00435 [Massilia horti]
MRSPVVLSCVVLLAACPVQAAQSGRVGEAEVREGANNVPCFTISEREERRAGVPNFDAVTVSETSGRRTVMWRMVMPQDRTFPVSFSMCVPYGGRVQALPQTPAARLEQGKVYHVRIDARRTKGVTTPGIYEARFCLAAQHDGSVIVHHIGRDDHEGRYLYGCRPRLD